MNSKIPKYVIDIMETIEKHNYMSYLVGGSVRDILLNKQPKDYDIATSATPNQIKNMFSHVVLTGEKYGTVTVVTDKGDAEITTLREDGIYKDYRKPESVNFTNNIIKDLSRRDFTINAIAFNIYDGLIDPFNGMQDITNKNIKTVGNPDDRLAIEDSLRMMRAIRFSCQLGFDIDKNTLSSIKKNHYLIYKISKERIRDELIKILTSDTPDYGINLLVETGLMDYIIPELSKCVGFDQQNPAHNKNIFDHTLSVLKNVPNILVLRLAALLHDIAKPKTFSINGNGIGHFYKHYSIGADMSKDILMKLKFDNKTIEKVVILVKEHMTKTHGFNKKSIKKLINRVGVENLDLLFKLQTADIIGSAPPYDFNNIIQTKQQVEKILNEKQPLTVKDLDINGYDLMELGVKPSKEMGEILNNLLDIVLEQPELNNKNTLIKMVKEELCGRGK